jgi:hypothetical protein
MILEVMGRDSGHIALAAGIAGGADVILVPEIAYDIEWPGTLTTCGKQPAATLPSSSWRRLCATPLAPTCRSCIHQGIKPMAGSAMSSAEH